MEGARGCRDTNIDDLSAPTIAGNGFRIRWFRKDDENTWARVERQAGEFRSESEAKERFLSDFPDPDMLFNRCTFVDNEPGETVGTATPMFGQLEGRVTTTPPAYRVLQCEWNSLSYWAVAVFERGRIGN